MSTKELTKLLKRTVENVELENLPIGPEWLSDIVCDKKGAMSKRMLKIWTLVLAQKLKEKG